MGSKLNALLAVVAGTIFEGHIEVDGEGEPWLRYDIDDSDSKEQWDEYCFISEQLKAAGLELDEPCVEHDCISGGLKFLGS